MKNKYRYAAIIIGSYDSTRYAKQDAYIARKFDEQSFFHFPDKKIISSVEEAEHHLGAALEHMHRVNKRMLESEKYTSLFLQTLSYPSFLWIEKVAEKYSLILLPFYASTNKKNSVTEPPPSDGDGYTTIELNDFPQIKMLLEEGLTKTMSEKAFA